MNPATLLLGPSGKASSMRAATLLVVATIMFTWSFISVRKLELQPLSETEVALVIGSLGVKAWQRSKETDERTSAS